LWVKATILLTIILNWHHRSWVSLCVLRSHLHEFFPLILDYAVGVFPVDL
jgi:hypothetical protein